MSAESMQVVAVANQKGGVGKTTTVVNLAASLGALEQPTLVIDMDPQSNATSGLGVELTEGQNQQIYHSLLGSCEFTDCIHHTAVPHVDVVPASADLIGFEVEGLELPEREYRLRNALKQLSSQTPPYRYVLLDCPPSLGLLTLNALTAANCVLVPLQGEYYAMEGLGRLLTTVELVKAELNPALYIAGIVLTMFDARNNLAHQVQQEVATHFPELLWSTVIPRNVRLSEAPSFGQPVLTYDIRSVGAQKYLELATECMQKLNQRSQLSSHLSPRASACEPVLA